MHRCSVFLDSSFLGYNPQRTVDQGQDHHPPAWLEERARTPAECNKPFVEGIRVSGVFEMFKAGKTIGKPLENGGLMDVPSGK